MQTTTERPARGAGATSRRSTMKDPQTVPTPPEGTQIVPTLGDGALKTEQAPKGMYSAHTPAETEGVLAGQVPSGSPSRQLAAQERRAAKARLQVRKLRAIATAEIERLIAFMDETDGFTMDEREPTLGFPEASEYWHHNKWLGPQHREECLDQTRHAGASDDRELEDEHDEEGWDREDDPADGPEEENEHGDGDPDAEPSLGWTNQMAQGQGTWGDASDKEAGDSYVTEAARQRYKLFDRYNTNHDGKHVDSGRGFGAASRRLCNLSDKQRAAVARRLNRDEVRV